MRLHRCARCRRHIRLVESRCPFCGVDTVARTTVTALTIGGALTGCPDRELHDSGSDDATGNASTTSVSSTTMPTNPTTTTSALTTDAESSATLDSGDDIGDESSYDDGWDTCVGFYGGCAPDGGGVTMECDVWAQDCPEGEKCMPWAIDGGGSWNGARCSPVDAAPHQTDEPCTVEGSGVSGVDDCALGAMCWDVDPDTNEGVCVDFCHGSEAAAICEDPARACVITNNGVLILCLPICDPLLQGCGGSEACLPDPTHSFFFCGPEQVGESGQHGDTCEFINGCDPGLFCADVASVAGCGGANGCCTQFCDLEADDPNAACAGALDGETCTPWFDEGEAPPGLAHVGACILPEA